MRMLLEWMQRLSGSFRKHRRETDMEEELRSHLDLASEDMRRRESSTDHSIRAARLKAGNLEQAMESMRDQRGLPWLDDITRDVRHALRSLHRTPGFTTVAILTLALGIGPNTAIFSVVNAVILRPLPYWNPDRLMHLNAEFQATRRTENRVSILEYLEFRQMNQSFATVGAYTTGADVYTTGEVNLLAGDRPLRARSISVDTHLLRALGIQPAQGRLFDEGEISFETRGNWTPVAILSHELWQASFAGQAVVGQTVNIGGRPHEIVGIMPPGADIMDNHTEVWLPLGYVRDIGRSRGLHVLNIVGRLKDGVTQQAAQRELDSLVESWGERTGASGHVPTSKPTRPVDHTFRLQPMQEAIVGDASRSIWILQVAVGFVLLIACANLANLLMARAESRRREFAVRAALGASRARLLRQTITEGLILALGGGILGMWLAVAGVRAAVLAYPASVPRMNGIGLDIPVLLFSLAMSVATGVVFGLVPVTQRKRSDLMTALKDGGDRGTTDARRHGLRRSLVVAEVAMAVMLVIGAGLLIRTVYNLNSVDPGFDRSRMVTFGMSLSEPYDPDTRLLAYQKLLDKLRAAPGVESVTIMSGLPPERRQASAATPIENYTNSEGRPVEVIDYHQGIIGDYFTTMGIPIVAGRGFEPADAASKATLVVVNETLAKTIWKGQNPIGRRIRPNMAVFGFATGPWHTVIGVAKDVKQGGVAKDAGTELYVSLDQVGLAPPNMNVVLRTTLPPAALSSTLQRLVQDIDRAVPIVRLRDMDSVFAESIRRPRFLAALLSAFAGLAMLLAAIGTYGVLSYMVTQRRREMGIRIALGASRSRVFGLVMKDGMKVTITGLAAGIVGALTLNEMIASLLFGVEPADTATLGVVVATIAGIAAIACFLPARRASRVDCNLMLREE